MLSLQTSFQTLNVSTYDDVLKSQSPVFGITVKGNPNANGIYKANLIKMITEISLFVNVGKNMDIDQINQTANLLYEKCMVLKIEDLKLFSKKFRTGEFGKLYDRLDGTIIIEAMDVYFDKRMTYAESIHMQEHHQRKKEEKDEIQSEWTKDRLDILKKTANAQVNDDVAKRKPVKREATFQDCWTNFYFTQFDKLFKKEKYRVAAPSGTYIKYNGTIMDRDRYARFRMKKRQDRILSLNHVNRT